MAMLSVWDNVKECLGMNTAIQKATERLEAGPPRVGDLGRGW